MLSAPSISAIGLTGKLASVIGDEVSVPLYGHFNTYPMPSGSAVDRSADGTRVWFEKGLGRKLAAGELVAKLRALPGDPLWRLPRPLTRNLRQASAWSKCTPRLRVARVAP